MGVGIRQLNQKLALGMWAGRSGIKRPFIRTGGSTEHFPGPWGVGAWAEAGALPRPDSCFVILDLLAF